MITVGSLFSGIGGIELGLERTGGFKTIWNSEIDAYASAVLRKHWPNVPNLGDITKIDWSAVERPDLICGGFPCQDISSAGKGAGIKEGTRSGLWFEFARSIRELRPKYALVENVSMLSRRGLTRVLGDLAEIGYDAEWFTLRASDVGAPHRRERLFIIAYSASERFRGRLRSDGENEYWLQEHTENEREILWSETEGRDDKREINTTSDVDNARSSTSASGINENYAKEKQDGNDTLVEHDRPINANYPTSNRLQGRSKISLRRFDEFKCWENTRRITDIQGRSDIPQPLLCRADYGLSRGMDRIKCLGNAVVPQVAQVIGETILEKEMI